jgi:hypothetical protein
MISLFFVFGFFPIIFGADICMDVGNGDFACSEDVLKTRNQVDGVSIDVGVTQRIDGSDSEKEAIREVLKNMDNYFFNEVLSMSEYSYVRPWW